MYVFLNETTTFNVKNSFRFTCSSVLGQCLEWTQLDLRYFEVINHFIKFVNVKTQYQHTKMPRYSDLVVIINTSLKWELNCWSRMISVAKILTCMLVSSSAVTFLNYNEFIDKIKKLFFRSLSHICELVYSTHKTGHNAILAGHINCKLHVT